MSLMRQVNARFTVEMFRLVSRLRKGLAFLMAMQALAGMVCRADDSGPGVHPPSAWVKPLTFSRPKADDTVDPSSDYRWLLSDRQINAQNDEEFVHEARQTLTSSGVQYGSHIMINFDPSCQSLNFHWARLWRGTNKLDRLDISQVHVSQAGLDTEEFLFSSNKTATLLLDDVRVGDIVDYAYSIEGGTPALDGKFFDEVKLQFRQPVERAVTRLVWPAARKLYIKKHLTDIEPVKIGKTNVFEFTWSVSNVPALRVERPTPVGYDPFPWVELSEWQKWSDVNRWALRLFTTTNPPSPELTRKINEWKKLPDPASRVLAALRFVQDEVRYLGMEDGAGAFEPSPPSVVFARRRGDCKDKSFLLLTMLRALQIKAYPVLVNTRRRQELAQLQPSPALFNHAIVEVNLEGQSYWLDSTATYERGPLNKRSWPNYGLGLKINAGVTDLSPIPPCPVQPLTTVREFLGIGGLATASTVKIVTVAEGGDADRLRASYATTLREVVENANLNEYAQLYPSIRRTDPLIYTDDEEENLVTTTEFYAIDKMWTRLPDESAYHARIYSLNVDEALVKPAVSFRTMPLGLRFPVHQIFYAEMTVPFAVPVDASQVKVDNPAFFFERRVNAGGTRVSLNYEYRSWADAVATDLVPAYLRDLDTASEALGYTVTGY